MNIEMRCCYMKLYRNGKLVENKIIYEDYDETPEENDIFCMSNIRGNKVVVPHKLPFSFYFSERESSHAIRVKPVFNPNRMSKSSFGTLELHGDWKYTPGPDDKNVSAKQVGLMKQFFKKYKVIFAGVWEVEIPEDSVQDYFKGIISFHQFLQECYFYDDYQEEMDKIKTIEELETFVRENNIFNMWD